MRRIFRERRDKEFPRIRGGFGRIFRRFERTREEFSNIQFPTLDRLNTDVTFGRNLEPPIQRFESIFDD